MKVIQEDKYKKIELDEKQERIYITFYQHDNMHIYEKLMNINSSYFPKIYNIYKMDKGFRVEEEYIDGKLLSEYIPIEDKHIICKYATQICEALKLLHQNNIIHRDLKPENIIVLNEQIKIIDFDISRIYDKDFMKDTQILGSVGYAAPEQFGFMQSDAKTDYYALGCLINELSTGMLPSVKLSDTFKYIVSRCIQIDKEKRYKNENEIIDELYMIDHNLNRYTLPGFRKGILWHKIISIIFYFLVLFSLIFSHVDGTIIDSIYAKSTLFYIFFMTWLYLNNYMHCQDLIPIKKGKIFIYIIFILGIVMVNAAIFSLLK